MGSKNRIAKEIIPIMLNYRKNYETHVKDYLSFYWDRKNTKLKNRKIMAFKLRNTWSKELQPNKEINKNKYFTLIN